VPRIHERGQISLPKAIREQAGLAAGDEVTIALRGDEIVIRKARSILDYRLTHLSAGSAPDEKSARADAAAADPPNRRV
jgi:AbrB family looped-hinge helix DNA binding protein